MPRAATRAAPTTRFFTPSEALRVRRKGTFFSPQSGVISRRLVLAWRELGVKGAAAREWVAFQEIRKSQSPIRSNDGGLTMNRSRGCKRLIIAILGSSIVLCAQGMFLLQGAQVEEKEVLGRYFTKKAYNPAPLPKFEEVKGALPSPIYDDNPLWVKTY